MSREAAVEPDGRRVIDGNGENCGVHARSSGEAAAEETCAVERVARAGEGSLSYGVCGWVELKLDNGADSDRETVWGEDLSAISDSDGGNS